MTTDWVAIFEGPVWRAKILQTQLEGYDIPSYVPEPDVSTPNLAITSLVLHDSCVMVPPHLVREARALLKHPPAWDKLDDGEPPPSATEQ
jgi:hypothetical protein